MAEQHLSPRDEILRLLGRLADKFDFAEFMDDHIEVAHRLGPVVFVTELEKIIDSSDGRLQIIAASTMLNVNGGAERNARAREVLGCRLQEGETSDRIIAASVLCLTGTATPEFVPALQELLQTLKPEDASRLWAAGAIFQAIDPNDDERIAVRSDAMWILLRALGSSDSLSVIIAAVALEKEEVRQKEVRRELIRAYSNETDSFFRTSILGQLTKADRNAPEVVELLCRIASSENENEGERYTAIVSLGDVASENEAADQALLRVVLSTNSWELATTAIHIMVRRQHCLPREVVDRLIPELENDDPERRRVGAVLLQGIGPSVEPAILPLLQRIEVEEADEVIEAVVVALASAGVAALDEVCKSLTTASLARMQIYQYVLLGIARQQPRAVGSLLSSKESRIRQAAGWALNSIGPDAGPAIEVLQPLLDSPDPAIVRDVLIAYQQIGTAAGVSAASLAKLLLHDDGSIRSWTRDALSRIGVEALAAVEALRESVPSERFPMIDDFLKRLRKLHPKPVQAASEVLALGVDGATKTSDLELFEVVADLLMEQGPLSFQKLETEVGKVRTDLSCSSSRIRLVIAKLEEVWSQANGEKVRLIDREANTKGGLTEAGRHYHGKVVAYLERLHRAEAG